MKKFLYDDKTIELFKKLENHPPQKILSDEFYQVGFDYGDNHILATPKDFIANSQNKGDEAIIIEFVEYNSPYKIHESERVMFENPSISRVFILRTLLYFTNHITYRNKVEAVSKMSAEEKADEVFYDILSETTGGHEEIICNPQSEAVREINAEFSNLVDAGILLEIDGTYLGCFSNHNSFSAGGQVWNDEEISKYIVPYYEFVKI